MSKLIDCDDYYFIVFVPYLLNEMENGDGCDDHVWCKSIRITTITLIFLLLHIPQASNVLGSKLKFNVSFEVRMVALFFYPCAKFIYT